MKKADIVVIDLTSSSDDEEEEGEISSNYNLRSNSKKKKMVNTPMKDEYKKSKNKLEDYDDDCIILDSDPFESIDVSKKLSITNIGKDVDDDKKKEKEKGGEDEEIAIVSEKGQVACRDFPHSRDLCVKFPFITTSHQSYCQMCYCYVCDSAAPCKFWTESSGGHCHATGKDRGWNAMRRASRPTPTAH